MMSTSFAFFGLGPTELMIVGTVLGIPLLCLLVCLYYRDAIQNFGMKMACAVVAIILSTIIGGPIGFLVSCFITMWFFYLQGTEPISES